MPMLLLYLEEYHRLALVAKAQAVLLLQCQHACSSKKLVQAFPHKILTQNYIP